MINHEDMIVRTFRTNKSAWSFQPDNGVEIYYKPADKWFRSEKHKRQHANKHECVKMIEDYVASGNDQEKCLRAGDLIDMLKGNENKIVKLRLDDGSDGDYLFSDDVLLSDASSCIKGYQTMEGYQDVVQITIKVE